MRHVCLLGLLLSLSACTGVPSTPLPTPTSLPTPTALPSPAPTPTASPTPTPTASPTPIPTATPSPTPSPVATATPTPNPTPTPVATATPTPTPSPVPSAPPDPSSVTLAWDPVLDAGVTDYQIFQGTWDPVNSVQTPFTKIGDVLIPLTQYTTQVTPNVCYNWYVVSANLITGAVSAPSTQIAWMIPTVTETVSADEFMVTLTWAQTNFGPTQYVLQWATDPDLGPWTDDEDDTIVTAIVDDKNVMWVTATESYGAPLRHYRVDTRNAQVEQAS